MSKLASAAIIDTVTDTPISRISPGTVMARNSQSGPAPSMRAASYRASSIFPSPDSRSTVLNPRITQVPMIPTAGSAASKSASHGRASPPNPTARSSSLTAPVFA